MTHTCPIETRHIEFDKNCKQCEYNRIRGTEEDPDLQMTFWEPDLSRRKPDLSELDGDPV